jgi:deazaflavin-dependent oxidoreductase (nitroreductase family)
VLFRVPILLYRARLGGLLGHRLVLIHHTGRTSGLPREAVVEVVERDARTVVVAAGFGPRSQWYRNLLATPEASVELGWRRYDVTAAALTPDEAADAMERYARRHPRAVRTLARYMGFPELTEPEGYRVVGQSLPMLRLTPR